mmetsp:Transcript_31654/g.67022  ORF Transcript_31654/g.67022 Transcript_31654/m.67022 type:complete len:238 (+) Transcript_31654:365-1078(+)
MMRLSFGILSIGMAANGVPVAAFTTPSSSGCIFVPASNARHHSTTTTTTTALFATTTTTTLFFREEDDAIDALKLEPPAAAASTPQKNIIEKRRRRPSDFQSRMKNIVVKQNRRQRSKMYRPENVRAVTSLEEFAKVIEEGRKEERVVVVRFVATWCKKCHSLRPIFDKTAISNPHVLYVDVPILETNSNLHQGLGVESVPFGHIYHPTQGLVEETKLCRKTFSEFEALVQRYCDMN